MGAGNEKKKPAGQESREMRTATYGGACHFDLVKEGRKWVAATRNQAGSRQDGAHGPRKSQQRRSVV